MRDGLLLGPVPEGEGLVNVVQEWRGVGSRRIQRVYRGVDVPKDAAALGLTSCRRGGGAGSFRRPGPGRGIVVATAGDRERRRAACQSSRKERPATKPPRLPVVSVTLVHGSPSPSEFELPGRVHHLYMSIPRDKHPPWASVAA